MKNFRKILALVLAVVMVMTFAACGGKDAEEETTAATVNEEVDTTEATEPASEEESTEEALTEEATTEEAATEEETTEEETTKDAKAGLDSTDKEEVIKFYQEAAKKTNDAGVRCNTKMSLVSVDGGEGAVGRLIDLIEPIGRSALDRNSTPTDYITGGWENIVPEDLQSASAKVSADGKYTEVTLIPKDQVDGVDGKSEEGSVGHCVSVLDGIGSALDELKGVTVDYSSGTIRLTYNNASVKVKIDNETGKIVSGEWKHTVNVYIDNVTAKVAIISATLHNASVVVNYVVTL